MPPGRSKQVSNATQTALEIRSQLEYAPKVKCSVPDLSGAWTLDGLYLCADCHARLVERGFVARMHSMAWKGDVIGCCVGCEPLRDESGDLL